MDPWVDLLKTYGFPVALIVAVSLFFHREVWPLAKDWVASQIHTLARLTSAIETTGDRVGELTKVIQEMRTDMIAEKKKRPVRRK